MEAGISVGVGFLMGHHEFCSLLGFLKMVFYERLFPFHPVHSNFELILKFFLIHCSTFDQRVGGEPQLYHGRD